MTIKNKGYRTKCYFLYNLRFTVKVFIEEKVASGNVGNQISGESINERILTTAMESTKLQYPNIK